MKLTNSRATTFGALVLAGVVVFVAARELAVEATYPVEKAKRGFTEKVISRLTGIFHAAEANAENRRLKREVAALSMVRGDNERLMEENDRLREVLQYAEAKREQWLAAPVLSTQGGSVKRGILRVACGSLNGVREGAVVAVPEGLVGRVSSVTPHTAEITLITDMTINVACEIEDSGSVRLRGIICGGNDECLNLRYVIGSRAIASHSRVVTSGAGGVFPRGIEIGFYIADGQVLPSVDFSRLEDVFIRREK